MNKIYRNRKGRYVTRETHERTVLRRAGIFAGGLLLATVFGIASHMTQRVDASNTMTDEQLCSLHAIACEGEATTTPEMIVTEVIDVEYGSCGEVALQGYDFSIEMLTVGMQTGSTTVVAELLAEQELYVTSVMYNEATKK